MSSYESPLKCLQTASKPNSINVSGQNFEFNSGTSEPRTTCNTSTGSNSSYKSNTSFQSPHNASYNTNQYNSHTPTSYRGSIVN